MNQILIWFLFLWFGILEEFSLQSSCHSIGPVVAAVASFDFGDRGRLRRTWDVATKETSGKCT